MGSESWEGRPREKADRCRGTCLLVYSGKLDVRCAWTAGQIVGGDGVLVAEPQEALIAWRSFPGRKWDPGNGLSREHVIRGPVCPEAANKAVT